MIFRYFLLGNLVSLCMKIINSVVVVGLYYGFLTTFSIGPSYLFLLRARVMEEEEGTEKLVSAKTGFIMGQLMMFISIYYAPLHLALDRPHTITVLVLPYLLFHLFFECELCILQYKNRKRKSIRNLTITCVFLNNLIFQLLNQFLLPSSTLARLVNVYMFRSNNKMLFVTSSFVGWLIGHIFFMKWFGLVLFWIRKITPSRPKKRIRFYGDYALEKEDLLAISLTLISIYYFGRMPSPTITRRVGKIRSEISQWNENDLIWFEGRIVNSLFDYKQWNRPLRYLKNDNFKRPVIDEMSQYFFRIRPSYGKQIITFTCPPSLSTLWKMIQRKFKCYPPSQRKKPPGLYRSLVYINREKRRNLCNEFRNRIKALGKGAPALDVLEKRTRLYNKKNKQNYLPKAYDPFLSGPYRKRLRGRIMDSPGIYTTKSWINRIHRLLVISFPELINTRDEDASITVKVIHKILLPDIDQYLRSDLRRSKIIERRRIRRKVPRWSYILNTDLQDAEKEDAEEPSEYYEVLLRKYDRLVVYSDEDDQEINVNSDGELEEKVGEIALLDYPRERDPYRGLIKGSMRAQRRKIPILRAYQPLFQSPLFLGRIRGAAFTSFVNIIELWKYLFHNWSGKDPKLEVSTSDSEIEEEELVKRESIWLEEMEIEGDDPLLEREKEFFDEMLYQGFDDVVLGLQGSRSLSLIAQSIFRKYILLPSTVIVKNIVRALFFQTPEWDADWRDWKKELHIYCTYNGVQISDRELPSNWLMGGIQIKVLFPFYPKPWRKSKLRSDPMKEKKRNADWKNKRKGKTKDSFYLTPWGGAKEKPFGPLKEQPSFFKPIWKKLEKRMRKELKKKSFSTLIRSFLIKGFSFLQEMPGILEEKIRRIQKIIFLKKEKIKEVPKENSSFLLPSELSKVHKPHKNREDSRLSKKFQKKRAVRRSPAVRTNFSRTQKNDIFIRRMIVIREINNIAEELERRKMFLTPDRNSSSPYETDWGDKRSESQKHIWQILKGKSVRFIRKWEFFVNSFIERIYVDIFLCTINSFRIHAQPLFESSKKMINKYIDNIEKNKEEFFETNQNTIHFISTLKESLFHISNISNEESEISRDLSSLSQAYVFYNLSQTQVINKYHLRSVLQDHGARLFFKDRIKEYLWTLGILDAKSSSKGLPNSGMNEWKNWLRGHYQYNFSQTRWSRLVSQKWRNKVRKRHTSQNKESKKDSYEKDQSIHCEKQKNYIMNSLPIQKYKFTKNYRYDLLSHKYIHYEDKKDSYSYISISDNPGDNNTDKNMGRKYLEWRTILYFSRKNFGIKHRINRDTGTNIKKKTKTGTKNYQILDNKDLFSLTIHQEKNPPNQKHFFDWVGMNEEMLYRSIPNQEIETWFFSELVPPYGAYKSKPRIIPIKLLFLNNESFSEQEKRFLREFEEYLRKEAEEKEKEKEKEKEESDQKNLGSDPPNQQKDPLVDSAESDIKNRRKQRQSKKDISGPQLDLLMRKHLVSQLNINSSLNLPEIMDIRTFSFLLKMMKYSNDIDIYSIEIGDIRMNFLATLRRLTHPILDVPTFIKRGIITIEPIRLFLKLDGQSIMYQIIGISLVHKNKHQTNEICREKEYDLLVPENIPSTRRRRELRIRICFNSASGRIVDRYPVLVDRYNTRYCVDFLGEDKHIDTDRNKLIQFKLFLWPNFRLEDLACMNRYWFDTNNGSRFSMSRIHMYPLQN